MGPVFWDVTQRIFVVKDVSVQSIGQIFKGRTAYMAPIGCPETSLTTNTRCVMSQKSADLNDLFPKPHQLKGQLMDKGCVLCDVRFYVLFDFTVEHKPPAVLTT